MDVLQQIPENSRTVVIWSDHPQLRLKTAIEQCPELHSVFIINGPPVLQHPLVQVIPIDLSVSSSAQLLSQQLTPHRNLFLEGRIGVCLDAQQSNLSQFAFVHQTLLAFTRDAVTQTAFRAAKGWHLLAGTILNSSRALESHSIAPLLNTCSDRPAVIVGAGPALDIDAPLLAAYKNCACIIACDAAWNSLIEHRIQPDFVISTDSRDCTWQHIHAGAQHQPDTPLITLLSSSWSVVRHYPGPLFFARNDWPLDRFIEQAASHPIPVLDTGKCVGNAAFDFACKLGCTRIILIGFNLGYEKGRYHPASRATAEFDDTPHDTANLLTVPGNDQPVIQTDYSMFYYLQYFEEQIADAPCPVVNATTGGARIKGTLRADLATQLQPLPDRAPITLPNPPDSFPLQQLRLHNRLRRQCTALLRDIRNIMMDPEQALAAFGTLPLPALLPHLDLLQILSSAENPAVSTAFLLSWEKWCRSRAPAPPPALLQNLQAFLTAYQTNAGLLRAVLDLPLQLAPTSKHWISIPAQNTPFWQNMVLNLTQNGCILHPFSGDDNDFQSLWKELENKAGVIMENSALLPFLWAFPGVQCIDVITCPPNEQTLIEQWLPGYTLLTPPELETVWRNRTPSFVPVNPSL